ncbi:GspH/FimT family pseudopilin [Shewanella glacialipiscicola]|uniref:GspH/FimT family pseudopilin n=1 Tax=Shewanella glacialipiscicola TaxID=614069 RepID=UPI003D7A7E06
MRDKKKAFTLVELMVTIAIAAILLTIGVPSLISMYEGFRANSNIEKIHDIMAFARNQAINYGATVNVCPFASVSSCGTNWNNGIRVYIGATNNLRSIDSFNTNDNVKGPAKIVANNKNGEHITFSPDGLSSGGAFIYCPAGKASGSRSINISPSGLIKLGAKNMGCT